MANRLFVRPRCLDKELVILAGSFAPNGSSAVSAASNKGTGWSVAWTSTGLFTITLADSYPSLISATASLQLTSGDDKFLQFGAIDVLSAKTLQIRVWDVSGTAVSDVAADAGNRINFTLILKNSSVTP